MACADNADQLLEKLAVRFYLLSVPLYNVVHLGRSVVNSFENTFRFCVELNLLKNAATCPRCRRNLKLSIDRPLQSATPVVFRCTNSRCSKGYISICQGSFFENSNMSLEQLSSSTYSVRK